MDGFFVGLFCNVSTHRNLHLRGSVFGESIKNVTNEIGCVNPKAGIAIHQQHREGSPLLYKRYYNLNEDVPPFVWTGQIFWKHLRD